MYSTYEGLSDHVDTVVLKMGGKLFDELYGVIQEVGVVYCKHKKGRERQKHTQERKPNTKTKKELETESGGTGRGNERLSGHSALKPTGAMRVRLRFVTVAAQLPMMRYCNGRNSRMICLPKAFTLWPLPYLAYP